MADDDDIICTIYKQYDGYPEGLGKRLVEMLAPIKLVNGIGLEDRGSPIANGMDCLAAQVVANLKKRAGDVYLIPPPQGERLADYANRYFIEYVYTIYAIRPQEGLPDPRIRLCIASVYTDPDKGQVVLRTLADGVVSEMVEELASVGAQEAARVQPEDQPFA
jgi:hypothetical protein